MRVKRSLDESLASLSDRSLFPGLEDIVRIEAIRPHELVITLRNRSTFLLGDLTTPISGSSEGSTPVGTGPFLTTAISPDEIVMSRFEKYYQGAPPIEEIIWKPYPALRTAWAGMMRGEIDFLYEVGPDAVEFVQGESSVNVFRFPRPYVLGVIFNLRTEALKDKGIRQALNFAIDRDSILKDALRGHGIVAHSPIRPSHWAYDPTVVGHTYDPARAAAILNAAEISNNSRRGKGSAGPGRLQFTCLLIDNLALWERMALLVQKQLFEVGVDMKLEAVSAEEFDARLARGDFDAAFLEYTGFSMSRPYIFWHSGSPRNSFGYRDQAVDETLDGIRRARDDETYRLAVRRLQLSMIDNPPGIFLAWGQTARAVSKRFQVPNEPDRDVFLGLSEWHVSSSTTPSGAGQTRN
jgi:peptide/nickel transport system substrate-binding protein